MIWKDRSGVGTLLVIAIVVILVASAAAAYIVLSGSEDKEEGAILAPGTVLKYDLFVADDDFGKYEFEILGQNSKEYFVKLTTEVGASEVSQYTSTPKGNPAGMKKTGTIVFDTMDGEKTLEVWEYGGVKSYVDPSSGFEYGGEMSFGEDTVVMRLTYYELIWQEEYKESEFIGKAYEYTYRDGARSLKMYVRCIADCLDGQYGVAYDFSSFMSGSTSNKDYFLCDSPQGLPKDAVFTESTYTLTGTIDGDISVEIWEFMIGDMMGYVLYYEPDTNIIYRVVLKSGVNEILFDLTGKP